MKKIWLKVELSEHEAVVLDYVMGSVVDPEWGDPLKDIYQMGWDEDANFDGYASLRTLQKKLREALPKMQRR